MVIIMSTNIRSSKETISVAPEVIQKFMPPRIESSRKGDNGIVLVVGGSKIYHGAPLLSSLAALRAGADLVYTAVPESNALAIRSFSPNLIVLPLPDDDFTLDSAKTLLNILPKKVNTVAMGMGMHIRNPDAMIYLINELKNSETKLILDASSLIPAILPHISKTDTVVTPHAGEYERLFKNEKIENEDDDENNSFNNMGPANTVEEQISNTNMMASKYGITIVLKGYHCIICNGSRTAVIKRTTPAMTVGGSGDVLSGVIATLLAKVKDDPFVASILAVYLNGIAAGLAYKRVGLHMVATDLIEELANAMKPYDLVKEKY
jgi:ADP-dependent NAD(P)H-hydrate dehydratase